VVEEAKKQVAAQPHDPSVLDLVFCVDCTASMGSYIRAAQDNIRSIVQSIVAAEKADVRFALVSYRDRPPEDRSYITRTDPFTTSIREMQRYVDGMSAEGGGDGPEAVAEAYHEVVFLPWRKEATKICIHIADAPPHGIEPRGDRLPPGWDTYDPLEEARAMCRSGITCYTVGCEPALGSYVSARDFLVSVADITGGQAVPLASADRLADVVLGGTREEIGLERLMDAIERDMREAEDEAQAEVPGGAAAWRAMAEEHRDAEVQKRVHSKMASRRIQSVQMKGCGSIRSKRAADFKSCSSISEYRTEHLPEREKETASRNFGGGFRGGGRGSARAFAMEECCDSVSLGAPSEGVRRKGRPKLKANNSGSRGSFWSSWFGDGSKCDDMETLGGAARGTEFFDSEERDAAAADAEVKIETDDITPEQVARMCQRSKARSSA